MFSDYLCLCTHFTIQLTATDCNFFYKKKSDSLPFTCNATVSSSLIGLDIFVSYTFCWPINNPISSVTMLQYPNYNCKFAGSLKIPAWHSNKIAVYIPIFRQYCNNQATEHKMSGQSFVNITLMLLSPKQCPDNHSDPKKRNGPKPVTMQCFLNTDYIHAFAIEILQLGLVS